MESQSDPQRQQTACQELLKKEGAFFGCLRRKTILHELCEGFAEQFRISWQRRYIVVYDGFLYNYKNETDNKPAKVIDLCAFQRVEREENLKVKGVPWPLKISSDIPNVKVLYFGAISEPELEKWIEAVKKGIDEAKDSGRHPVTVEKKKRLQPIKKKMPKKQKKPHSSEGDDGNDDDLYTSIAEPGEDDDYQSGGSDYSSIDGKEATAGNDDEPVNEPKEDYEQPEIPTSTNSGKQWELPQLPDRDHDPAKRNPARKPPISPKKPDSNVSNKPLPKEPEADDIVSEATWMGTSEAGIEKMKSIDEEGVFMLRESTTGKGDLTLQIISDDAVRKYRITKEGTKFRMAGGNAFDSIAELLTFYQNNSIPNHSTKLTKPYSRI